MEILILLGIGFIFWLFTSKTKKNDLGRAAKSISKSLDVIETVLDSANEATKKLVFEEKLKNYERLNPKFHEITFRNFCKDRADIGELVEDEILKRKLESDRIAEQKRIKKVLQQIIEAKQIKKEENIDESISKNTKAEISAEQIRKQKYQKIDETILKKKEFNNNENELNNVCIKDIDFKENDINIEQCLISEEIKVEVKKAKKNIETNLTFNHSEKLIADNADDSDIFLSTTKLGRVFGVKAKPDLFDYLVNLKYLEFKNKKYELTKKGFEVGRYGIADDGAKFPQWNINLITDIIQSFIQEKYLNFDSFNTFYHLTHIDNLESIFEKGLYCHSNKHEYIDVSNIDVNSRRDKVENIHKNKIHDYVPFYFNVKNAMLYAVQKRVGEHVIILEMDKSLCCLPYTIFCDRNAATYEANFTSYKKDLNEYDWIVIFSESWTKNREQELVKKQKMMAECLVKAHVAKSYIKVVHCQNIEKAYNIRTLANQYCLDIDIRVTPELFF